MEGGFEVFSFSKILVSWVGLLQTKNRSHPKGVYLKVAERSALELVEVE